MSDTALLSGAFSMLDQPVVVSRRGKIIFMNSEAIALAGADHTGKPVDMLMPSHISNNQANQFVTTAFVGKRSCIVRVSVVEGYKIFVLSCNNTPIGEFSAVFSSLKSSMSNIKFSSACISVLAENEGNEKLLEYVCSLNRSYYRIKRTIENYNTLSGLADHTLPFCPEPIDITELCRSTIDTLNTLMDKQDVRINFNAEPHTRIIADRVLIRQLLLNLISNSLNHSRRNGRISISLLRTDANLIIGVDDDGTGIPPEELPRVFDRYRYGVNLSRPQGSGMGLAVVRGIAELHKGTVIVESRGTDMGTSVRVMLSYDVQAASGKTFSARDGDYEEQSMQTILTGMSDCLTADCYSEALED